LQPNRPQHREPDSEEDSDREQQSAYQKLLSTMIQVADDNSEDEESEDEDDGEEDENDGEEVEGKVSYFLSIAVLLLKESNGPVIKNHSQVGESGGEEKEEEEEGDDDDEEGETPDDSQDREHPEKTNGDIEENMEGEFTDKKNEAAFCLETNLPAEEEENTEDQEQGETFP